ncbi:MAG: translocation/assembly module TamB domain-containing protein [Bacteroidales bacterium]
MLNKTGQNLLKKTLKILLWIVVSFISLFIILSLLLLIPAVQTSLTSRLTAFVKNQTGTEVTIDRVAIKFPTSVGLKGIFLEDEKKDTLLYAGSIFVDVGMLGLLRNEVNVHHIELSDVHANMIRSRPDTVFNYQFLIDAMAGDTANANATQSEEKEDEEPSSSWDINIGRVDLQKIRYRLKDYFSGTDMRVSLTNLTADMEGADVLNEKYHAKSILINGLLYELALSEPAVPSPPDTTSAGIPEMDISLGRLLLENTGFRLNDDKGFSMKLDAGKLDVESEKLTLHEYLVQLKKFNAQEIIASIKLPENDQTNRNENTERSSTGNSSKESERDEFAFYFSEIMEWDISVENFSIKDSEYQMQSGNASFVSDRFNPEHMQLKTINLEAKNMHVSPETIRMDIDDMRIMFSEEFQLTKLQTNIDLGQQSEIKNFVMETNQSNFSFDFTSGGNLLNFEQKQAVEYPVDLIMDEINLQKDLVYWVPQLNDFLLQYPGNKGLKAGGRINGKISDFSTDSLWASSENLFAFHLYSSVKGLPDIDSLYWDLAEFNLFATPYLLHEQMTDSLVPQNLTLPEYLYLESQSNGNMQDWIASLDMRTDLGRVSLQALLKDSLAEQENIRGNISFSDLNIARIIQNEDFGEKVDFDLQWDGQGTDPAQMDVKATAQLKNLVFRKHHYDTLTMNLSVRDSTIFVDSQYKDPDLEFVLDAESGIFKKTPHLIASFNLPYAMLSELGFSKEELLVKTDLQANTVFAPAGFFSGDISLKGTSIANQGEITQIPDFFIHSDSDSLRYKVDINSKIAELKFRSNASPAEFPTILAAHFSPYMGMYETTHSPDSIISEEKNYEIDLSVFPQLFVTDLLVADLQYYDTLNLHLNYSSADQSLSFSTSIDSVHYSNLGIKNFQTEIQSKNNEINFHTQTRSILYQDIELKALSVQANMKDKETAFNFSVLDSNNDSLYAFNGGVENLDTLYQLSMNDKDLILNREKWNVDPKNKIIWGQQTILIDHLTLESKNRLIGAQSSTNDNNVSIIDLDFKQIELANLTDFSPTEIPFVGGLLNGTVQLRNITDSPVFLVNATLENFNVQGDTIGDIAMTAENPEPSLYQFTSTVKSTQTHLELEGSYRTGDESNIDFNLGVKRLELSPFDKFTGGSITDLKGDLSGNLSATGTLTEPEVTGELSFKETFFNSSDLNNGFYLKEEVIKFEKDQVRLQNFTLRDTKERKAFLDGSIDFADFSNISFNLDLIADNFLLMDVPKDQNDLYWGTVLVDSDLRLTGNQTSPAIEGNLKLNEGSNFTFKIPQTQPQAIGDEGIVEFTSYQDTTFYRMAQQTNGSTELSSSFETLDIGVNLEINKETDVKIIIDEYAGDFLQVEGGGVISFGIDRVGRITMSGQYEIQQGEYLLTFYDVIRRNFTIEKGSNITWSGEPMDAEVDIRAKYTVRTNARDLMTQTSGDAGSTSAQQYPFQVFLNMEGDLEKPDISFELDLPEEHQNAMDGALMAQIEQINRNESERNKQVFALLIIGTFLPDNPFDAVGGGAGLTSTARSSASQILTQQLNRLSQRYIKGVDIDFNVQSSVDYTGEQQAGSTELEMKVSRDFFDERVKVTVGGNIELENEEQQQRQASDIAGDFMIEYLITPEGNLYLKGFRTKNYTDIFDGEVIETGVSLEFSKSYDRFRQLFRKEEQTEIPEQEKNE